MKLVKIISISLGMFVLSASIAQAANFSFSFDWCEGSPEFNLKNVPKGATKLKLNMIDHDYRNGSTLGG